MPTYLGPADTFEHEGKTYRPGQNVPANKELVAHMARFGHRFEGNVPEEGDVIATPATAPAAAPAAAPEPEKK